MGHYSQLGYMLTTIASSVKLHSGNLFVISLQPMQSMGKKIYEVGVLVVSNVIKWLFMSMIMYFLISLIALSVKCMWQTTDELFHRSVRQVGRNPSSCRVSLCSIFQYDIIRHLVHLRNPSSKSPSIPTPCMKGLSGVCYSRETPHTRAVS